MQKRALKQLNKVTQWTNEKVFSGEKTQLSDDFTAFEKEVEVRRIGIERLHATSMPFLNQLTKVKPTADPYAPSGSGKDKILITEALGLVMISYGDEVGGSYGDALAKYGRARCKLAAAQEEFSSRISAVYITGLDASLGAVNEYKAMRKKLDSRRLTLDAAITKVQTTKKDPRGAEEELRIAQARFEETEEETQSRLIAIQEGEEEQFSDLADLLDAEMDYFARCRAILEDLRNEWPSNSSSSGNRPRAKSNASGRSAGRAATTQRSYSRPSAPQSSEEDVVNRSRSGSTASASRGDKKDKRSMMPSFGSLGKKTGSGIPKTFRREKYGNIEDDGRHALHSEESAEDEDERPPVSPISLGASGRARSQSSITNYNRSSVLSVTDTVTATAPSLRRTQTTPSNSSGRYVKALFDFKASADDELQLRVGQIVEVKSEVSSDWYIGDSEGRSGLFPSSYVEEYVPTPTTAVPSGQRRTLPPLAGAPVRRTLPPMAGGTSRPASPPAPIAQNTRTQYAYDTEESDHDYHQHDYDSRDDISDFDQDHKASAGLTSSAQPTGMASQKSIPPPLGTVGKKAAPPPPPPSRRSASSSNLMTASTIASSYTPNHMDRLAPPPTTMGRARSSTLDTRRPNPSHGSVVKLDSSPEGSPFAGSEDDEESRMPARSGSTGLSHGLGGMHIGGGGASGSNAEGTRRCGTCGCEDFTQNVFKAKGTCSTCFHVH